VLAAWDGEAGAELSPEGDAELGAGPFEAEEGGAKETLGAARSRSGSIVGPRGFVSAPMNSDG
jgi:hypothetical protein